LAATYLNMGVSLLGQEKLQDALDWFTKTLTVVVPACSREPRIPDALKIACSAHADRGLVMDKLNRYAEAISEFDKGLAFDDGEKRMPIRRLRAKTLVRSGDRTRATSEADALTAEKDATADTIYDAACIYALCATAVRDDHKRADEYASRAVELLGQAVAKGYRNKAGLQQDPELNALRSRDEFKRLLHDLDPK
jgi:tetratricopeptide (TPR) repeat protein